MWSESRMKPGLTPAHNIRSISLYEVEQMVGTLMDQFGNNNVLIAYTIRFCGF